MSNVMQGYEHRKFEAPLAGGHPVVHDVYERGEGTPVILIQELPGIGPETLRLAERLVEAGHRVSMPHLFGPLGKVAVVGNTARVLCMWREFRMFAKRESSPVVGWLRALCRDVRDRSGAAGVGVIGMCLTGNFAITLIGDESVLAAVASQPSLPLTTDSAPHMSDAELQASRDALDASGPMIALRIAGDRICSAARFDAIGASLNDGDEERIRMITLPGEGHSVLTIDFVDEEGHPTREALTTVLDYFADRLTP